MGLQRFPISDFRGGLNTKDGPFALESNEAQDLLNVTLSRRGVLYQRAGKTAFTTIGTSGLRTDHIRPWYFGSTKLLMSSTDGDVYSTTVGGTPTQRYNGAGSTIWCFEQGQDSTNADRLWMMDGTAPPQKWDGATGTTVAWTNTPPNGTMLRVWRNRMCIAGVAANPQRLFFSDIGNPESPAATYGTNWVDIKSTEDDVDPITWIEVFEDYLVVFKKQSTWLVTDPTTFANRRLGAPGCEGRFQSAIAKGRCYFLARSGVWSIRSQGAPRLESEKIENFITDNLAYANIANARVWSSRDRRVFIALPMFGTTNNRVLEFIPDLVAVEDVTDPRGGAWTVHDWPIRCACTFRITNTDELVAAEYGSNKIHRLFVGSNDDGVAISSYWLGTWRSIISEEPVERIRRVNLEMSGRVLIEVFSDFSSVAAYSGVLETATDPDPLWDGGVWDGGQWDPINSVGFLRLRPETRGRYHALKFSNNILDKSFTIYAAELAIRGGKEHTK